MNTLHSLRALMFIKTAMMLRSEQLQQTEHHEWDSDPEWSVVYKTHKSMKARQTGCDHSDKCLRTRGHKLKTSSKKQKFNQKCVGLLTLTDRYRLGSPTLSGFRQKYATQSCSFKFTPRLYQL